MEIEKWCKKNNFDCQIFENIIKIENKLYFCLPKKEKIVYYQTSSKNLMLSISRKEQEKIKKYNCDYIVFYFGTKYYYCPTGGVAEFNEFLYIGKRKGTIDVSFPYLGIHGPFELCNSVGSYDSWCKKASFMGIDSLGICDKNTLAGTFSFQKACQKHGIKSILGASFSVNNGKIFDIMLYAKNKKGWRNLLNISKITNFENRPLKTEEIKKFSSGLFCVISKDTYISDKILKDIKNCGFEKEYYQTDLSRYTFPKRDKEILDCFKNYMNNYSPKIEPVMIVSSNYIEPEQSKMVKKLNKIGKTPFSYQSDDSYFKNSDEIINQTRECFSSKDKFFEFIKKAIHSSREISDNCDFKIETSSFKMPSFVMDKDDFLKYRNNQTFLAKLINDGFAKKLPNLSEQKKETYGKRVERELEVIKKGGFVDYFLILWDICEFADKNKILRGIGRGSAGGSLVSYLLDLTRIDPIEHGLIFERFLNEGRIETSLPDIDTDFQASRRPEIKRYIEEKYGIGNVCSIGTYTTLKARQAFKDLCRLRDIPAQTANYYSSIISSDTKDFGSLIKDAAQSPKLLDFFNKNFDMVEEMALILRQPKTSSVHAAGVLITPTEDEEGNKMNIWDWIPVKKMDGVVISEWEGPDLDSAGFLKEDILGIRQLDKFDSIFKLIEENGGSVPDFEKINYEDPRVYELFQKGHNQDLFHFGSPGQTKYGLKVQPENMDDLIAMISLYRTGVMESGGHEEFVELRRGRKKPVYDYGMEEITRPTFSILIYQEQVMEAVQSLGGISLVEADTIRSAMGKKIQEKMDYYRDIFIKGAISSGCPEMEAAKIWNKMAAFAKYSFNKAHATAYAKTGYICQYLKAYHPMEYWTTSLSYAKDDEIAGRVAEIYRSDDSIKLLGPDVNHSGFDFNPIFKEKTIYWSFLKIAYIGEAVASEIIVERERRGKFFSFEDFVERVSINKRALFNLIISGAFDHIEGVKKPSDRKKILKQYSHYFSYEIPLDLTNDFHYSLQQKSTCGFGFLDFYDIVKKKCTIRNAAHIYSPLENIEMEDMLGQHVVVSGILIDFENKKARNGEYGRIKIDENNYVKEIVIWSDKWLEVKEQIEGSKGKIVFVSTVVNSYRDENVLQLNAKDEIQILN